MVSIDFATKLESVNTKLKNSDELTLKYLRHIFVNKFHSCWLLLETSQPWPLLLWLRNSLLSKADAMSDQVPCTQCTYFFKH